MPRAISVLLNKGQRAFLREEKEPEKRLKHFWRSQPRHSGSRQLRFNHKCLEHTFIPQYLITTTTRLQYNNSRLQVKRAVRHTPFKEFLGKTKTTRKTRRLEENEVFDTYKEYKHLANIKHSINPSQIILKPHDTDLFT